MSIPSALAATPSDPITLPLADDAIPDRLGAPERLSSRSSRGLRLGLALGVAMMFVGALALGAWQLGALDEGAPITTSAAPPSAAPSSAPPPPASSGAAPAIDPPARVVSGPTEAAVVAPIPALDPSVAADPVAPPSAEPAPIAAAAPPLERADPDAEPAPAAHPPAPDVAPAARAAPPSAPRVDGEPRADDARVDLEDADTTIGVESVDRLIRERRLDDARASLDALSPAERAAAGGRISAARLHLAEGRGEDAVRELEPLATAPEASAAVLALYGRAQLAAGNVGRAARAYSASSERDAHHPEALLGRAELAVRGRRGREALFFLDRLDDALEVAPRPPRFVARARYLRGRAFLTEGRGLDARRTLARVIASEHAPSEAFFYYAEAQVGHNHRAARDAYLRYLELEPDGYYGRRARRALGLEER